ncbi:hypothetical protein ACTMTI_49475 [Nonomuraea sp. H19]|uniref:hypothetical protein n=1 Tax=Nonomuraea sp. H19 TaxID=3452206 RepID=UPI003F8BCD22
MSKRRRGGTSRHRRYGTGRVRPEGTGHRPAVITASGNRDPGRIGKVLLVLMWAGICLVPIPLWVPAIQLAAGAVGTPGTLTVEVCEPVGRNRYDCEGTFVPGGGRPVPVSAPPDLEAGDTVPAQLTPEGDRAAMAGPRGVFGALTLPFFCVGGIGFLPYVVLYWSSGATRRHLRAAAFTGWVLTTVALMGITIGLIAIYSV